MDPIPEAFFFDDGIVHEEAIRVKSMADVGARMGDIERRIWAGFVAGLRLHGCSSPVPVTDLRLRWNGIKLPFIGDFCWPMAGTRIAEIGATLLTSESVPQRPVWSEQFRNSNVACQSEAVVQR
jgi:hypothetical protein